MSDATGGIDRYLQTLGRSLEALGPAEAREVVTEVRGLLEEAAAEASADTSAAGTQPDSALDEAAILARFGSPEVLAASILEERGISAFASRVPDARLSVQVGAALIDAATSLLLAIVVLGAAFWGLLAIGFWPLDKQVTLTRIELVVLAFAVFLGWWWLRKRRRAGFASTGMRAVGIRRIQAGETTRVVYSKDIPGEGSRRRFWPAVKAGVAVALLVSMLSFSAWFYFTRVQGVGDMEDDIAAANSVVIRAYEGVVQADERELRQTFLSSAYRDKVALQQRYNDGQFGPLSYEIGQARVADDSVYGPSVIVPVTERDPESSDFAVFELRVSLVGFGGGQGVMESAWLIESVEKVE